MLIERAEAQAWAEMFLAQRARGDDATGVDVERFGGAVALLTDRADAPAANRVIGLGLDAPVHVDEVAAIIDEYRARHIRRFLVQWSPAARPPDADAMFRRKGFRLVIPTLKLCRRVDHERIDMPDAPAITEIGPDAKAVFESTVAAPLGVPAVLAPTISSAIGLPRWHFYLAVDGDRPIAGAALFTGGDVAWCGLAATVPAARGRGAQAALLIRRLRDAAAAGCAWVSADTQPETPARPNPSFRNMRRLGFEMLYERANYMLEIT